MFDDFGFYGGSISIVCFNCGSTNKKDNMSAHISFSEKYSGKGSQIYIGVPTKEIGLAEKDEKFIHHQLDKKTEIALLFHHADFQAFVKDSTKETVWESAEYYRRKGWELSKEVKKWQTKEVAIYANPGNENEALDVAEGLALSLYSFTKYKTASDTKTKSVNIVVVGDKNIKKSVEGLEVLRDAVFTARDLVNEPVIHLTAKQLGKEFEKMGKAAGFEVEVFDKKKIESLKMGGLLAVNIGAPNPPTFTVMEYKPAKAVNKKPLVLVGKGVVYDTGGLSLKPTTNSMDAMKSDMAGAAAVGATMFALAKSKLPLHVIALVPATENRPDGNAITPGDVITISNGKTVEVLNTDAEGRLILSDALSYAQKYKPMLVLDFATLTGSAARAIGKEGIVCMGTAETETMDLLKEAGRMCYERLVEFPLWDEYEEHIKSDIADIKNVGGSDAGAISAGIFLKHFTSYPWVHFDIAGSAFLDGEHFYKPKNGTGVGVRFLLAFAELLVNETAKSK
jgi:leucyl aminopeptidase